jgi:uroporphyrinogen-III synthase
MNGQLDGILFTSPRTVDHFVEIADAQDSVATLRRGVAETIVGAIGTPTADAVHEHDMTVEVKPDTVGFNQLADITVKEINTHN